MGVSKSVKCDGSLHALCCFLHLATCSAEPDFAALNAPFFPEVLEEKNTPHSWPPYGRYMAEYWMMNDAGERPEHSDNNAPDLIPPSQVCPHSMGKGGR